MGSKKQGIDLGECMLTSSGFIVKQRIAPSRYYHRVLEGTNIGFDKFIGGKFNVEVTNW